MGLAGFARAGSALEGGGQTQHAARNTARVVFPSRVDGVIRRLPLIEIRVNTELRWVLLSIGKSTASVTCKLGDFRNVHSTATALRQPKEADSKQETYVAKMESRCSGTIQLLSL